MTFSIDQLRRCTVAVDLGATRTRVHLKGAGIIVDQPSVVAVNTYTGALIAVGSNAARMDGRTPGHIRVIRPATGGSVVDIDMARRMLRALVGEKIRKAWRRRPLMRAAMTIPHAADPLARRAALETMTGVGAKHVELVDAPVAAAVGAGLPVEQPEATMVVTCGATTTQIAVLSLGSVVAAQSVPVGGETVHNLVVQYLRNRHELVLPHDVVRPLSLSLALEGGSRIGEVHGRDVVTGLGRTVRVDAEDVREAVQAPLTGLVDAIRAVLHRCPPDLVADLAERGMTLTGGSAGMPGLDTRLRQGTGMLVQIAEDPATCAVRGLAAMMEGSVEPLRLNHDPDPMGRQYALQQKRQQLEEHEQREPYEESSHAGEQQQEHERSAG